MLEKKSLKTKVENENRKTFKTHMVTMNLHVIYTFMYVGIKFISHSTNLNNLVLPEHLVQLRVRHRHTLIESLEILQIVQKQMEVMIRVHRVEGV